MRGMPWHLALLLLASPFPGRLCTASDKSDGVLKARIWQWIPLPCAIEAHKMLADFAVATLNALPQLTFNITGDQLDLTPPSQGSGGAMSDILSMSQNPEPYTAIVSSIAGDESVYNFANAAYINVLTEQGPSRPDSNPLVTRPYYLRVGLNGQELACIVFNTMKIFGWKRILYILDNTRAEYFGAAEMWKEMSAANPSGPQVTVIDLLDASAIPATIAKVKETGITILWLKIYDDKFFPWICAMSNASMIGPTYVVGSYDLSPQMRAQAMSGQVCSWEMVRRVMIGGLYVQQEWWGNPSEFMTIGQPIGMVQGKYMQSIMAANAVRMSAPDWPKDYPMPFACPLGFEGFMFDAITVLAFAVQDILRTTPDFLKNFKYSAERASMLHATMANLTFVGATGKVRFFPDGRRVANLRLLRVNATGSWSEQARASSVYPVEDSEFKLVEPWHWCDASYPNVSCGTFTSDMVGLSTAELQIQGKIPYGIIQECSRGEFRGPLHCQPCPSGAYAPMKGLQRECLPCQPGFYCPRGSWKQMPCSSGSASTAGASECTLCPAGSAQFSPLSEKCPLCQPGFVQPEIGQKTCIPCKTGEYQDLFGNTTCKPCPSTFTTAREASTALDQCGCGVGTFHIKESAMCKTCSQGITCDSFHAVPLLEPGYYMPPSARRDVVDLDVYKCMSQEACPGQKAFNDSVCGERFAVDSVNCGLCQEGYYLSGGSCVECGSNGAVMPLFIVATYIVAGIMHWLWNHKATAAVEAGESILASVTLGVTLAFTQSLGIFNRLKLIWPSEFKDVLDFLAIFLFDMRVLRPSCLVSDSLGVKYALRLTVPLFIGVVFTSWFPVSSVLHRLSGGRFPKFSWDGILCSLGMVIQAVYISLAASTLSLVDCYESPNGKRTVRAYPDGVCGSSEYDAMLPLFVVAMLVYVVGIFAILTWLCWIAPREYIHASFRTRIRFLVFKFRSNQWWFGLLLMIRSFALAMVTVAFPDDAYRQFLAMVAILGVGLFVHLVYLPYLDRYANNLESMELGILITIMVVGSWFMTPRDMNSDEAHSLSMMLLVLVVLAFVTLFVVFCWAIFLAAFPLKALAMHEKEVDSVLPLLSSTCVIMAGTEQQMLKDILQHASYMDRWHLYEMVHFIRLELCGLQALQLAYRRLPKLTSTVKVANDDETVQQLAEESKLRISRSMSFEEPTSPKSQEVEENVVEYTL